MILHATSSYYDDEHTTVSAVGYHDYRIAPERSDLYSIYGQNRTLDDSYARGEPT